MKVTGVRHTGITVSNLEKSIAFYRDVIGMEVEGQTERSDELIGRVVGIPGTHLKAAFLTLGPVSLELLEYVTPKGKPAADTRPNDVGNIHVAFVVEDIEAAYQELQAKGMRFADRPQYITEGRAAIYCWDPDGINLELVQLPKE